MVGHLQEQAHLLEAMQTQEAQLLRQLAEQTKQREAAERQLADMQTENERL
ncbi:hypothetical protein KIPB_016390, partial [Kipferlia bialata]|eukprot:g16390.t1